MIQELYTLRASYDQVVNILLYPLVDVDDLEVMIQNPVSDLWTVGPIADGLRDLLGPVYQPLILAMEEVSEILISLSSHLNIEGSKSVS